MPPRKTARQPRCSTDRCCGSGPDKWRGKLRVTCDIGNGTNITDNIYVAYCKVGSHVILGFSVTCDIRIGGGVSAVDGVKWRVKISVTCVIEIKGHMCYLNLE